MNGTYPTLEHATRPVRAKLNDFDIGSILSTAANILPDGVQAAGQSVIDTVLDPVKDMAKSISPELYATLDRAAQKQIDDARSAAGLPPVNPESVRTATAPSGSTPVATTPNGAGRSTAAAGATTASGKSFVQRVTTPWGYGGAVVGAVGGWFWTGRGEMKKSTGKRVGVSLLIGALTGVATGFTQSMIAK
ncbi:MAG: hypothetical protein JSS89_12250 [Bacteroidetes bacterium]|nr:hypothetical protein [Bacteroidota bacterium]